MAGYRTNATKVSLLDVWLGGASDREIGEYP